MKKLKSFTVLELLIVITITSIIVGVAYTGSSLFFKEFLLFQERSTKSSSVSTLDRLLLNDIESSTIISMDNNVLYCQQKRKRLEYYFSNESVVRKDSAVVDSFKFEFDAPITTFKGKEKAEGLIDNIEISLHHNEQPLVLQYQKFYGADVLMQFTTEK